MTSPMQAVRATPVVLALGSNLGYRLNNLQGGLDALFDTGGLAFVAVSPVYETSPVGPPQPDYLNAVVLADCWLPARMLLDRCHASEAAFERVRTEVWGPRTLDVDLIVYGDEVSNDPELTLPHPRAHERAFVLAPWLDVDPEATLPGRGPVRELLAGLDIGGIRRQPGMVLLPPPGGPAAEVR